MADPMKVASPHMHYPAEFGRSRSNSSSVIKEIPLRNLTPRDDLSRSLKVIANDTDQSGTYVKVP